MTDPWRYRNKAQVPIAQVDGKLIGGFYAQGSHRIIDMDTCLIQHENNDEVIRRVKSISREIGISAYDETTHKGLLRHVVVKIGVRTGEMMLVLVTNGETIPHVETLIMKIRHKIPNVKSICHNVNREKTNVIFGNRTSVLWGAEFIHDYIGDIQFEISARSFYQVNPIQTEVLYQKALDYAGLTGNEIVIDAYCGIGTISLFLAKNARHVYGVEIVGEAIADARRNAKLNDLRNVALPWAKQRRSFPRGARMASSPTSSSWTRRARAASRSCSRQCLRCARSASSTSRATPQRSHVTSAALSKAAMCHRGSAGGYVSAYDTCGGRLFLAV